jgi:hypothetical protein
MKTRRWRSSTVEQLICNQQAAGSIPIASSAATERARGWAWFHRTHQGRGKEPSQRSFLASIENSTLRLARWPNASFDRTCLGGVPERSKGTDCKSVATGFEGSNPSPSTTNIRGPKQEKQCKQCGSSSVGRALAFQARRRGFEPRLPLNQ